MKLNTPFVHVVALSVSFELLNSRSRNGGDSSMHPNLCIGREIHDCIDHICRKEGPLKAFDLLCLFKIFSQFFLVIVYIGITFG